VQGAELILPEKFEYKKQKKTKKVPERSIFCPKTAENTIFFIDMGAAAPPQPLAPAPMHIALSYGLSYGIS
jgi:hypothetical protein